MLPGTRRLPKASDVVVAALRERIINQHLPEGTRLPSETDLMEQLQVGRVAVREGLRLLERDGLVEVRRGNTGGIFVRHPEIGQVSEAISVLLSIRGSTLREFVEFRQLIEPAATALAAGRVQPDYEQALLTVEQGDFELSRVPDLHLLIAEMTGNGVLAVALNAMHNPFSEHFRSNRILPSHMEETSAAHAKIARLIRTGDVEAAQAAMTVHLDAYGRYIEHEGLMDEPIIPPGQWGLAAAGP